MPTHVLRNFLYLDQQAVDDYLAGLQGALYEETITEAKEIGRRRRWNAVIKGCRQDRFKGIQRN